MQDPDRDREQAAPQAEDPPRLSRRAATGALGALAGAAIAGCGDDAQVQLGDGGGGSGAATTSGGSTTGTSTAGSTSATSAAGPTSTGNGGSGQGGAGGQGGQGGEGGEGGGTADACADSSDLSPLELLAGIDTFVILCMENRSFDHYLGSLSLLEGRVVDGLTGAETNPDAGGNPVGTYLLEDFTPEDPPHSWDASHAQWGGGMNDGFVLQHDGPEVMGYHVRDQIPITYALADAGAVCDRYFASVMGPTWPNRFYLQGATSKGIQSNFPTIGFNTIFSRLEDAGATWKNYFHDVPWRAGAYGGLTGNAGIEEFFDRAQAGTLPNVSFIDPQFFGGGANDDHPDHHIFLGQALIASVYQALAQSPQWGRCLLILTYDEHGGFFDHVAPPTVVDDDPDFEQLGFRVPTILAGPYVRSGCTVSTVFDHTSILRTLALKWGLPDLTARMADANDLTACIDPGTLEAPKPPVRLPQVPVVMNAVSLATPPGRPRDHAEIWDQAESGAIPPHLDRRADGERIARHVLAEGVRLGAVRIVR